MLHAVVTVMAGPGEVGLWDVAAGACRQVLRYGGAKRGAAQLPPAALQQPAPEPTAANPLDPAALAAHLRVQDLHAPPMRPPGVQALLATGGGNLLAAGGDGAIRNWAPANPAASYLVAAPPPPPSTAALTDEEAAEPAMPTYKYSQRAVAGVPVIDETASTRSGSGSGGSGDGAVMQNPTGPRRSGASSARRRQAALSHRDAVLDLAAIEVTERMLVSCSRDGIVKVWK